MRHKPVPPVPDDLETLGQVRGAVSLVPREEESCCLWLMDRANVPSEDEARTWLTFLTALGLVEETDRGFVCTRDPTDPDREHLATAFEEGVYGVRELVEIADETGPVNAEAAFRRFREHVPRWERHRSDRWERTWRERVGRLLEWGVLLGVFERDGTRYSTGSNAPE